MSNVYIMIFEEIKISEESLIELVNHSPGQLESFIFKYIDRRFYIGDTGILRKTLNAWKNSELLPYNLSETGWQKFSFVECCWLFCIRELSSLGVSLKKIKDIKNELFKAGGEKIRELFIYGFENFEGELKERKELIELYKNPEVTTEMMNQLVENMQLSPFLFIVLSTAISNQNIYLFYDKSGQMKIIKFGKIKEKKLNKENQETITTLFSDSFVGLSFRKIISSFFNKEDLLHNDGFVVDFLQDKEKKIIDQIREKNAKEITIKFNDSNEPTHIRVKRSVITNETINKVARYLKRGNYQAIEFVTRDGKLIKYEETDNIKLD